MRERIIEKRLTVAVEKLGGRAYKFVSPGNDGVPDRIILLPGGIIHFVELKYGRNTTTGSQDIQIEKIRSLGFDARVLRGVEEVEKFIREITDEVLYEI